MPIICFEGASAVGKTTLSKYLRDNFRAYVISEVNLLFKRTENRPRFWYFERQVERWRMALEAANNHKIVILDGDPFQPLWYNWSYNFDFGEPFEEIMDFYHKALAAREIDFPDKYFILSVAETELKKRKINDDSRRRKNFERHLRFIEPQRHYFSFMKSVNNNLVEFVENKNVEETGEKVINSINAISLNALSSLESFGAMKDWLGANRAAKFISSL
jgi:thymidylate kinase